MKRLLIPIMIACIAGCSSPDAETIDSRLIGKWTSDRGKTLRWIKDHRTIRPDILRKMAGRFGRMSIEYTDKKVIATHDNRRSEFEIVILGRDHDSVAVMSQDPITQKKEILLLRFENDDTYSVYISPLEIREFFVRIPEHP
jgi:hypothetical protein